MPVKTGAKKHTHKYHRLDNGVWACVLSDCTHFMPLNVAANLPGKKSLCWECSNPMILDAENMRNEKPVCAECSSPELISIREYLKERTNS